MKRLYRRGTVFPTPTGVPEQILSLLPAAILTLTAALSKEERELLAYLISCSSANFSNNPRSKSVSAVAHGGSKGEATDHPPCFDCCCFCCYRSYWVKWNSSSNRQLIHEIIDAFEDNLLKQSRKEKNKRERRKSKNSKGKESPELNESGPSFAKEAFNFVEETPEHENGGSEEICLPEEKDGEGDEQEKSSVKRFMSFLGERIWGVWG